LQKVCHSTHEVGDADHFFIEFVVSRERKHALGQDRTPLSPLRCIFEQGYAFRIVWQTLAQQFKTAKHRGQQVVKIMGDSACELTNRLELLRLERELPRFFEFFLGFLALGDVAGDLGIADSVPFVIANGIDDDMSPKP
jgi:hypothetical protein